MPKITPDIIFVSAWGLADSYFRISPRFPGDLIWREPAGNPYLFRRCIWKNKPVWRRDCAIARNESQKRWARDGVNRPPFSGTAGIIYIKR